MKVVKNLKYIKDLSDKLSRYPHLVQVLIGPRQVGKTTSIIAFLKQHYADGFHYYNSEEHFQSSNQWVQECWYKAQKQNKVLVIDEVQKIPDWAQVIKAMWDQQQLSGRKIKCIVLGSSSLSIQKGLSESLAGRFMLTQAFHWNYTESKEGYNLSWEEYLEIGGYPGAYPMRENLSDWQNYVKNSLVQAVIEKDILLNHTVKSPALFRQCFEILTSYPAQEISYTKLLGQLQNKGNTDLIKHYLSLFEGAFLIKQLSKFSAGKIRQKASSPKIIPLCPAFYYMQTLSALTSKEKGRIFELIVGMALLRSGYEMFYWRDGQYEVDYVLKFGKNLWAIEVKSGQSKKANGLLRFNQLYPDAKMVMINQENYIELEKDVIGFLQS